MEDAKALRVTKILRRILIDDHTRIDEAADSHIYEQKHTLFEKESPLATSEQALSYRDETMRNTYLNISGKGDSAKEHGVSSSSRPQCSARQEHREEHSH